MSIVGPSPCTVLLLLMIAAEALALPPLPYVVKEPVLGQGSANSQSDRAIAREGDWLVVGVPRQDVLGVMAAGSIAILRWREGRWDTLQWLALHHLGGGLSNQANAHFGASVALSGDRVLIGCPGCESPRPKAYLVELTEPLTLPPTWYPLHPALISAHDPQFGIGAAVAMNGNLIAVGAPNARSTVGGVERGAAALGHFDGSAVIWDDIVFGPASPAGSRFGQALVMTNSAGTIFTSVRSLLVGAPAYASGFALAGRAYLYERPGFMGSWSLAQEFANDSPSGIADALGWSVAIARPSVEETGYIALGAPGRSVAGTPGGAARLYTRAASEAQYAFSNDIQHPTAEVGDRFGISVGLAVDSSAARVLAGADGRDIGNAADQGAVYVFQRFGTTNAWLLRQTLEHQYDEVGNVVAFGRTLTSRPSMAVIGMTLAANEVGVVRVFICDQIFADRMEGTSGPGCGLP